MLDHAGAVAESYVHTCDGTVTITNAAGGTIGASAIGWHQGYGQMYRDAESGFLYSVYRYYQPATGRFVTEDPLGRWFDSSGHGNGYSWAGSAYRNGWDPLGLETVREQATSGIVAVMQAAAAEAAAVDELVGAVDELLGGGIFDDTPEDVTEFIENISSDDIDWQGGLSGNLADTLPKNKDNITRDFRVRINIIKIFRGHWTFADVIAHEMEHVRRFRCGEESPHHESEREAREYDKRGKKVGDYLRVRSTTLRLFEAWLEHLSKKNGDAEKQVAEAARNAINGTAVPK